MPKKLAPKEVAHIEPTSIENLNEFINEPATSEASESVENLKAKKLEFVVTNSSGAEVRTYTVEEQGKDAEAKAKEYAFKIGGTVK